MATHNPHNVKDFIEIISKTRKLLFRLDRTGFKRQSSTLLQFHGLMTLDQFPGITVNEMARKFFMSSAAVTQYLNRLTTARLITKRPDPRDKRMNRLYLTRKGRSQLNILQKDFYHKIAELLAPLSQTELRTLINIHQKLLLKLEDKHGYESH